MNRTDRLYAIVEELRAISPRLRTARQLAERHGVSPRTIERDIAALQQAGIPVYADVGRRGGYALEKSMSLPPLNFTAAETVALALALARNRGGPFDHAGRSALGKVLAAMPERNAAAARDLAARVRLVDPPGAPAVPEIPPVIGHAIERRLVLRIGYLDQHGQASERTVEPVELLNGTHGWYLIAWCRLRDGFRVFRLDRMRTLTLTDTPAPIRPRDGYPASPADHEVRAVAL
ncbi:YafY family protein [Nocardia sp. XZ_19_385]|uniref:helix-turn-helix transcriptional regulator n=1 Tax=Nocardia sp. XZ_19_385 TaxID=2769488 RepID=UPI00188DE0CC|nr:YafY family protein [Nocardia sp. XZ_19_385]